jgi:transposase
MDLLAASKPELIRIIYELRDTVAAQQAQIAELKSQVDQLKTQNLKEHKKSFKKNLPKKATLERKKREHGYSRVLDTPTDRVMHALDVCNECGGNLGKPTVSYTRQIMELPKVKVKVTEHVVFKRWCFNCKKQVTPNVDLSNQVVGRQRVGIRLMSTIAVLRDRMRLPFKVIQTYLKIFYGLALSKGEIIELCHTTAKIGKPTYDDLLTQIRSSPVVHADETGGRENGQNGYFWSYSTPKVHFLLYRKTRAHTVVEEVFPEEWQQSEKEIEPILVTDFYAAYNCYLGLHQRCWVHLLRDIDELLEKYPDNLMLKFWSEKVCALYGQAVSYKGPDEVFPKGLKGQARINTQHQFEQDLLKICAPYIKTDYPQATLCARVATFLPELFTFIRFPEVKSHNNDAERVIRHLVISRKISGGTRSEKGSETKSILTSLFDSWKLQNKNPLTQCQLLLTDYH